MNRRQGKWFVIIFFASLVAFCLAFTFGLAPYLERAAKESDAFNLLGKCIEVHSANTLVVEQRGEQRTVRLTGIAAPPMNGDTSSVIQYAEEHGANPHWLARQGQISRNTLAAWIYRRGLHLVYPFGEEHIDEEGNYLVYAEVAGIDVAMKLLEGGQVYAIDTPHPRLDTYKEMEQRAQAAGSGIWRTTPQTFMQ